MWKFLSLSSNALNTLCIHLSMIVSCGIDPLTTPSERKRKLLVFTRCISLCLICLQVFSTLLYQMKYIVFYVLYIICSVSTMILYGVLTFMFRLRKNMTASYGDSKLEYQLTNLETKELKEWEYGMELPPMPVENHPIDEIFPSKP